MLPTFVIGLREGLEAALIVGIIAAFLRQRGRLDALRLVWLGVGAAVLICLAIGIALKVLSAELPQRQQEGLETVVAVIAVGMVTYMVVWMRRHARDLKGELEGAAESALVSGSAGALVAMAFLAVLREGFETAVFLLAAFNESDSPAASGAGVLLGILLAAALGYGIYRGGVRINLARFFTATGAVLVLVAAGLLVSAVHTAHAAGWIEFGQESTVDLTWLVQPGSVLSSLLTGMLGLQPKPVLIEVVVWLAYVIVVGLFVLWPSGRRVPTRAVAIGAGATAAACAVAAALLALLAPGTPHAPAEQRIDAAPVATGPLATATSGSGETTYLDVRRAGADRRITLATTGSSWTATPAGAEERSGRATDLYVAGDAAATPGSLPRSVTLADVADANGGRLPLGITSRTEREPLAASYETTETVRAWIDRDTGRLIDAEVRADTIATVAFSRGPLPLSEPVVSTAVAATPAARDAAVATARDDAAAADDRSAMRRAALILGVVAVLALIAAAAAAVADRRRGEPEPEVTTAGQG
ncbi:MAG: iron uptake transporter permease EfeU [Thermoleophilia bacterium]